MPKTISVSLEKVIGLISFITHYWLDVFGFYCLAGYLSPAKILHQYYFFHYKKFNSLLSIRVIPIERLGLFSIVACLLRGYLELRGSID